MKVGPPLPYQSIKSFDISPVGLTRRVEYPTVSQSHYRLTSSLTSPPACCHRKVGHGKPKLLSGHLHLLDFAKHRPIIHY
jgi:hypothetical protein